MTIYIGKDHAGTNFKFQIKEHLKNKELIVINHGTDSNNSVDYPDFVHPVAKDVLNNKSTYGILICGSANGVAMTANKYPEIRAGICWNKEITSLIRLHNNANILCIPARFTKLEDVLDMVDVFLTTDFEGGRHQNRINKITLC
jgi:ribose 5-phosphate isomerase B